MAYFLGTTLAAVFFYGVLEGVSGALYWDSYHTSFGIFGKIRDSAEEVAGLQVLQSTVSIFLPFVSSAIIAWMGFHAFYAVVFAVTILTSVYLLHVFGETHRLDFSMSEVLHSPFKALHISDGVQYGFTWVIPIFLYILFSRNVLLFGALKTAIGLAMAIFSYLIARYYDRKRAYALGNVVYIGNGFWTALQAILAVPSVSAISEIGRGISNTFAVTIAATIYRAVKKRQPALVIGRSFFVSVGKSISFTIALLLSFSVEFLHIVQMSPLDITRALILLTPVFALSSIYFYGGLVKFVED